MALPIRPGSGLPVARPAEALPDLGVMPELPESRPVSQPAPAVAQAPAPQQRPVAPVTQTPKRAPVQAPTTSAPTARQQKPLPEGWAIDKATGKRYKKLPGFKEGVMSSKAAIKAGSNGGMSLDQLRATVREEPDLNPDDLNGAAEIFMSHLRVPPDKDEQKRLLEERAKREAAFESAYERVVETEPEDDDSL